MDEQSTIAEAAVNFTSTVATTIANAARNASMDVINADADAGTQCRFHGTPENYLLCVCFFIIFALSMTGNSLVIAVIVKQRAMRSITNTYLLNLAISDLTLSAVCMPPTLHSMVMSCWMFGDFFCKLFAYLQPVVVAASAYTLAVIAFERYFAICSPLHSRIWQTRTHAYCMITLVWVIAIVSNLPISFLYQERGYESFDGVTGVSCMPVYTPVVMFSYQIYMTIVLLLVPLVVMTVLYGRVISTLRNGIRMDIAAVETCLTRENSLGLIMDPDASSRKPSVAQKLSVKISSTVRHSITSTTPALNGIRSTHTAKTAIAKQRVIRMLLVIVVVFFCCWTPSYIWWLLLMAGDTFQNFSVWNSNVNTVILILTYISCCSNPITYCFMNKKFRTAMLSMFGHKRAIRSHFQKVYVPNHGPTPFANDTPKPLNSRGSITDTVSMTGVHHLCVYDSAPLLAQHRSSVSSLSPNYVSNNNDAHQVRHARLLASCHLSSCARSLSLHSTLIFRYYRTLASSYHFLRLVVVSLLLLSIYRLPLSSANAGARSERENG
ncbi:hypothetical protein PMAYCL1PPCAC_13229 [Pristionchus mayeri]|uniref:G-protein coupled receptors family 1 profile domain-containing protein n=1 Tax=Pristionchus mayeri TaxID=1317129 RepID=A0AAN4ZPG1_9BILA|nr:hypothetical protein PMAYCL1PPCAC_13229 [Pristionchus mayeri]